MILKNSEASLLYLCICDAIVVLFIIVMPIIAHLSPIPLYVFEPMRLAVFATILLMPNRKMNAIVLALFLPAISYVISGHPIAVKNVLIAIELVANIILFELFFFKTKHVGICMFSSIILSKLLYYSMKYVCISIGLLTIDMISTSLLIQLIVAIIISFIFSLCYKK